MGKISIRAMTGVLQQCMCPFTICIDSESHVKHFFKIENNELFLSSYTVVLQKVNRDGN